MRLIERQMNQAIRYRKNFTKDNTAVRVYDDSVDVYLHGNHIATLDLTNDKLTIKDGGWQTVTTKSRLNALLDEFDYGSFVFQKNWQWFFARNFNPSHKVDFISGMVVK